MIQRGQWVLVFVYLVLIAVPAFLLLPGRLAHIVDNLTLDQGLGHDFIISRKASSRLRAVACFLG